MRAVDFNPSSTSSSEEEDTPEADRCWCFKFAMTEVTNGLATEGFANRSASMQSMDLRTT